MALLHTLPVRDGFAMPAEFAPHVGTVLIWPVRPGSWGRPFGRPAGVLRGHSGDCLQ